MAHKLLKPASIAFYFLMLIAFFFGGMYFAGLIDAGKNQGLAGGAIVFGYGVLFAGIAFIASFFIARYVAHKLIVRFNWLLIVLIAIAYGITHYRYLERQKEKEKEKTKTELPKKKTSTPAAVKEPTAMLTYKESTATIKPPTEISEANTMGMGFFAPEFFKSKKLYFYNKPNLKKNPYGEVPIDSITYKCNLF